VPELAFKPSTPQARGQVRLGHYSMFGGLCHRVVPHEEVYIPHSVRAATMCGVPGSSRSAAFCPTDQGKERKEQLAAVPAGEGLAVLLAAAQHEQGQGAGPGNVQPCVPALVLRADVASVRQCDPETLLLS
jgi:hypothetical protein